MDFDQFSENYDECLKSQINISGEDTEYFDIYKVNTLMDFYFKGVNDVNVLDYGCGIGKLSFLIAEKSSGIHVTGYDISKKSIENATARNSHENLSFTTDLTQEREFDFIIVSNVFHHILSGERMKILEELKSKLKKEGKIIVIEHNPLNPITRYVVKNCAFDVNAEIITLREFIALGKKVGLSVFDKRYIVFFPSFLKVLRPLEKKLGFFPLGAQYVLVFSPYET
ncbi:MAG: class I SAM-dependent methyltransferase [Nitrospinae bacterium]|nr:class I SAM-dependent methyltransferase [Nitrospinota bacterium]